jgi:hypothetical protein
VNARTRASFAAQSDGVVYDVNGPHGDAEATRDSALGLLLEGVLANRVHVQRADDDTWRAIRDDGTRWVIVPEPMDPIVHFEFLPGDVNLRYSFWFNRSSVGAVMQALHERAYLTTEETLAQWIDGVSPWASADTVAALHGDRCTIVCCLPDGHDGPCRSDTEVL